VEEPAQVSDRARVDRLAKLRVQVRWGDWILLSSAVVAFVGLLVLALITRRDIRAWHWFTVLAFGAFAAVAFISERSSTTPWRYLVLPLDGVALAAAALDLRRGKHDSPGRLFAWAALLIAILSGLVLLAYAFGV
jgi:hypothetical protein